eukprot:5674885-Alexandrium_andersonii.AAC.1
MPCADVVSERGDNNGRAHTTLGLNGMDTRIKKLLDVPKAAKSPGNSGTYLAGIRRVRPNDATKVFQ